MTASNIKATRLTASGQVSPSGVPCHVVGYHVSPGTTATSATFLNGGSGGASIFQIDAPASSAAVTNAIFGYGVNFTKDCYVTLAGTGAIITVFWY